MQQQFSGAIRFTRAPDDVGRRRFEHTVDKIIEQRHRTLFDFVDSELRTLDPHARRQLENTIKRHVHLGLARLRWQVYRAFATYVAGEGRSPNDRAA